MGMEKHELMMREENWRSYAEANRLRCDVCGSLIGYDERELIGQRICSHCKHVIEKDD